MIGMAIRLNTPLSRDFVIRNEWKYIGDRGIRGEYSISAVSLQQMAGQKGAFTSNTADPFVILEDLLANDNDSLWTAATKIKRVEASAKTGYVFPRQEWKSIDLNSLYLGMNISISLEISTWNETSLEVMCFSQA